MDLKKFIRSIPDYPKKGILFRDITTLIKDEKAFEETINQIVERSKKFNFTKVAAIESRGFVFASAVPPVAIKSSMIKTVSSLFIESLCTSIVAVPYSNSKSIE